MAAPATSLSSSCVACYENNYVVFSKVFGFISGCLLIASLGLLIDGYVRKDDEHIRYGYTIGAVGMVAGLLATATNRKILSKVRTAAATMLPHSGAPPV